MESQGQGENRSEADCRPIKDNCDFDAEYCQDGVYHPSISLYSGGSGVSQKKF